MAKEKKTSRWPTSNFILGIGYLNYGKENGKLIVQYISYSIKFEKEPFN